MVRLFQEEVWLQKCQGGSKVAPDTIEIVAGKGHLPEQVFKSRWKCPILEKETRGHFLVREKASTGPEGGRGQAHPVWAKAARCVSQTALLKLLTHKA